MAKVGAAERGEYRKTVVQQAIAAAVDTGKSMNFGEEELTQLFLQVLRMKYGSEGKKGEES